MSRFVKLAWSCATALVLTAGFVANSQAQLRYVKRPQSRPPLRQVERFDVSGVYGGLSAGWVSIDGVLYPMSPKVKIYELGRGVITLQSLPVGSRIYAAGIGSLGAGTISSMISRPFSESYRAATAADGVDASIRTRDPSIDK